MTESITCGFKEEGVGKLLSNLYEWHFALRGIECAGIEGFLQASKFADVEYQKVIAQMHGFLAFRTGQEGNGWKDNQTLYWNGEEFGRHTRKWYSLVAEAFDALYEANPMFREALLMTGNACLVHWIGKDNTSDSTLTHFEYTNHLYRLRARAFQEAVT
jgi:predicted NAD-dependent protein-ADP-ribosyltransferase YbiA (DUF1768 family)